MTLHRFRAGFLIFLGLTVSTLTSASSRAAQSQPNPLCAADHVKCGDELRTKKDWDGAIREYREAIRLNPDYLPGHANLGWALQNKNDWDGAIAEYRETIRLKPDLAEAHLNLGEALENKGDFMGAFKEYRTAHSLNPQEAPSPLVRFWRLAPLIIRLLIILLIITSAFTFANMLDLAARALAKRRARERAESVSRRTLSPGATIGASPPPSAVNARWLRVVRITAGLSMAVPALLAFGCTLGEFPLGLPFGVGFALYVVVFNVLLGGDEIKKGLAWAVGTGLATLLLGMVWVIGASEGFRSWGSQTFLVLAVVCLPAATLEGSAIKTYYTAGRSPGDRSTLMKGLLMGVLYFCIIFVPFAAGVPGTWRSRLAANQASAVGSLRTINTAAATYVETYRHGYPETLRALGPPMGGKSADATAADLIDEVLASGRKSGYVFTYKVTAKGERGFPSTYTINADPVQGCGTGNGNCYFTDETGVIRYETTHPANKDSPPPSG